LSTKDSGVAARYLVILSPARTSDTAAARARQFRTINDAVWSGFEKDEDLLLLQNNPQRIESTHATWSTDAAMLFVRRDRTLAAQQVTTIKRDGQILFASDK